MKTPDRWGDTPWSPEPPRPRRPAAPRCDGWGLGVDDDAMLAVPLVGTGPESRYVFRFGPGIGWVFPSGFSSGSLLEDVPTHERWAVGGVVIDVTAGTAEARFAITTPDAREPACELLHHWASATGWTLTIADGDHALRPFPGRWNALACVLCGTRTSPSATSMPYARTKAWATHACHRCGGVVLPTRRSS